MNNYEKHRWIKKRIMSAAVIVRAGKNFLKKLGCNDKVIMHRKVQP